jgi:hypothetical protein
MKNYKLIKKCRICSKENLHLILDLGIQPPANALIDEIQLENTEERFPLRLFWCSDCCLVQLLDIVDKEHLFKHYLYMTSASKPIVEHFRKYAKEISEKFLKNKDHPFVVEIGSNDGSLLKEFKKLGMSVLGIEPASNLAKLANESDIPTKNDFFSFDVAQEISKHQKASVVVANNVIGHIENLHDLMKGIEILIDDKGIFVFEVPYLIDLMKNLEFDTIYHEHLSYFSILPIINLLERYGLEVFDIQKQSVHGGTMRVFVSRKNNFNIESSVEEFINLEHEFGLEKIQTFENFSEQVIEIKSKLLELIKNLKKEKMSLFGYGASAKGNVLLNFCKLDNNILDFIIDTTPTKQGKFTPGTHIPILPPDRIKEKGEGDTALLLAWNYKFQILEKEKSFRTKGGKFLVPFPTPELL